MGKLKSFSLARGWYQEYPILLDPLQFYEDASQIKCFVFSVTKNNGDI